MRDPLQICVADAADRHCVFDLSVFDPQRWDVAKHHHQRNRHRLRQVHALHRHREIVHRRRGEDPKAKPSNGNDLQHRHAKHAHDHTEDRNLYPREQSAENIHRHKSRKHLRRRAWPASASDKNGNARNQSQACELTIDKIADTSQKDQQQKFRARIQSCRALKWPRRDARFYRTIHRALTFLSIRARL